MMALEPVSINGQIKDRADGFFEITANDQIHFPCEKSYMPHIYYVV